MAVENPIPDYLSVRATTLEEAWSRFDPQTPLPVGSPFYITRQALDEAVRLSGGVFREIAHILQKGIDNALAREDSQVKPEDVAWAAAQIRSGFRRLLNDDDYRLLLDVRATNEMRHPDRLSHLFHLMAVLEYSNDENWCDVHPALDPLLDEIAPTLLNDERPDEVDHA